jgi:hypothetical protein
LIEPSVFSTVHSAELDRRPLYPKTDIHQRERHARNVLIVLQKSASGRSTFQNEQ